MMRPVAGESQAWGGVWGVWGNRCQAAQEKQAGHDRVLWLINLRTNREKNGTLHDNRHAIDMHAIHGLNVQI